MNESPWDFTHFIFLPTSKSRLQKKVRSFRKSFEKIEKIEKSKNRKTEKVGFQLKIFEFSDFRFFEKFQ